LFVAGGTRWACSRVAAFWRALLLNKHVPPLEAAVSVARKVTTVDALLDVHLIRHVVESAAGKVGAIKNADAPQVLGRVDAISNCSRKSALQGAADAGAVKLRYDSRRRLAGIE
jgi:hypothetical protein